MVEQGDKKQWWRGAGALDTSATVVGGAGGDEAPSLSVAPTAGSEDHVAPALPSAIVERAKPERSPLEAAAHGLDYIYVASLHAPNFEQFGTEILHCLNDVAPVAPEPVRARCLTLLKNTAYRWRTAITEPPEVLQGLEQQISGIAVGAWGYPREEGTVGDSGL